MSDLISPAFAFLENMLYRISPKCTNRPTENVMENRCTCLNHYLLSGLCVKKNVHVYQVYVKYNLK